MALTLRKVLLGLGSTYYFFIRPSNLHFSQLCLRVVGNAFSNFLNFFNSFSLFFILLSDWYFLSNVKIQVFLWPLWYYALCEGICLLQRSWAGGAANEWFPSGFGLHNWAPWLHDSLFRQMGVGHSIPGISSELRPRTSWGHRKPVSTLYL